MVGLSRVYPASCLLSAGTGSVSPHGPAQDKQTREWMGRWMDDLYVEVKVMDKLTIACCSCFHCYKTEKQIQHTVTFIPFVFIENDQRT